MLRDRLLRPRALVSIIVMWGVALAAVPRVADAAPLPPARDERGAADVDAVRRVLEEKIIRAQLDALGVSVAEAAAVLERLSPEERSELAARAQELGAGGNGLVVLGVAIVVAALVILILELTGRRVISRG